MAIYSAVTSFFYGWSHIGLTLLYRPKTIKRLLSPRSELTLHSRLTSGIFFIHAITTPLSALLINLDLCLEQLEQPDTAATKQFVTQALLNAKHMQQLVSISHRGYRPLKTQFFLKPALHEVVIRLHQPWHNQEVHAHLKISPEVQLRGHPFYFQEAISCLLRNAFEAYGSSRIKTVALTCYQRQHHIVIHISDLGAGMTWMTRQLLDVMGFSLKPKNTGVGLSFVKAVIEEQYHGKVIVQSVNGGGTTITLLIPYKH